MRLRNSNWIMVLKPGLIQYARRFETIARHAKMSESWLKLCTLVSTLLAIISCAVQIIRKRYRLGWHLKICKNTFCRYTSICRYNISNWLYRYRFKLIDKISFFINFLSPLVCNVYCVRKCLRGICGIFRRHVSCIVYWLVYWPLYCTAHTK